MKPMNFSQWFDEVALSINEAPIVVLKNGIRIANFSSPHSFTFDDGTVLPACSAERANSLMLNTIENESFNGKWTDVDLTFAMSQEVSDEIARLEQSDEIDIILVPFPVLEAMKKRSLPIVKCRVCRVANRVTKVLHSDKFCC